MKQQPLNAGEKAWLYARRVFTDATFNGDIEGLRQKWRVPAGGFKATDKVWDWFSDLYQSSLSPGADQGERMALTSLRRLVERAELNALTKELGPLSSSRLLEFWSDLEVLRKRYRIPPRWRKALQDYLFRNDLSRITLPGGVTVRTNPDDEGRADEIYLVIDRFTTLRDVKEDWPHIVALRKNLTVKGRQRVRRSAAYSTYKKAAELREAGMSYQEIADEMSTEKKAYSPSEISTLIRRYKDMTKL